MLPRDIAYIIILAVCFVLSAVFSLVDMTYSSVKITRLENESRRGNKKAQRALSLADNYDNTIAAILFGNDFVNILSSSIASLLGKDLLEPLVGDFYSTLTSLILLFILLVFCEITPKAIGKMRSFSLSLHCAWIVKTLQLVFYPIVHPLNLLASKVTSSLAEKAGEEKQIASDLELESMVDEIQKEGIIDSDQSELLHRSIDFKETSCYEIMTPRIRVFGYDIETSLLDFLKRPDCFKHSRVIIYKENLDHVLGYIQITTLLRTLVMNKKPDISKMTIPIVSVPRTMMISSAMKEMADTHRHIAVVKDEYGGTEGILTMEDILEELVGEMWDEVDDPELDIQSLKERDNYLVNGSLNIDDFMNYFGIDPDRLSDDYSTVAGFIMNQLGRFAKVGDSFDFENLTIKVVRVTEYSVFLAKVTYHRPDGDNDNYISDGDGEEEKRDKVLEKIKNKKKGSHK